MALVCRHHTSAPAQQAVGRVVVQADGLIWALHIELEKKNQVLCQVWTWSSTLPDFSGGVSSLAASPKKWSEILSGRRCRRRWPCCCIVFTQGDKVTIYDLQASLAAEACSTTEDGDEPLHCPTGYECHIINPGNTAEGIPNRGQCIKLRGNPGQLTGNLPFLFYQANTSERWVFGLDFIIWYAFFDNFLSVMYSSMVLRH